MNEASTQPSTTEIAEKTATELHKLPVETPSTAPSGSSIPPSGGGGVLAAEGAHGELIDHRLPRPESIKKLSSENLCEIKFIKSKMGFWTVEVSEQPDSPITIRDRNEVQRQFKIWFRRRQRKIMLDNHAKQREAAEKETG
ncbi:hypothetical protein LCGC14_2544420 [marine sediment metagenome]|uniref:Uncharacterized protein n=1 Tax=marine sediment metagenome TaxID=412755 RepID=A0A0F9BCK1_9ZZZZ